MFNVNGLLFNADEFGNYAAGFSGGSYDAAFSVGSSSSLIASSLVMSAGIFYDVIEDAVYLLSDLVYGTSLYSGFDLDASSIPFIALGDRDAREYDDYGSGDDCGCE